MEEARKKNGGGLTIKAAQERAYKFMLTMAGDLPQYEEALRALYKRDKKVFVTHTENWPPDIRAHALTMAKPVFAI